VLKECLCHTAASGSEIIAFRSPLALASSYAFRGRCDCSARPLAIMAARAFGSGYPADVQMMDESAQAYQTLVLLQGETRQQNFDGDLRAHMREFRAIEGAADNRLEAILRALQPKEAGLRVEERRDEPGRPNVAPAAETGCGWAD
jgi:hypothetical protein